ncbi:hypothetical protein [Peptoniphilus obesi]|uniref:hypothetical protein n=1 Tax=Peptoniphilus obesi TaxID=1472765 RepID=UPI0004B650B4|nr:hypothetical protein [Peptoniphilus obesi]
MIKSDKNRKNFLKISWILIIFFIISQLIPSESYLKIFKQVGLDGNSFLNFINGVLFDCIILAISGILIIFGIFFVKKNILVYLSLIILAIPHVFILIMFYGLSGGDIIEAFRAYFYIITFQIFL